MCKMLTKPTFLSVLLLLALLPTAHAQKTFGDPHELSEVVKSLCANTSSGLFVSCEVEASDDSTFFAPYIALGLLEGQFTDSGLEESVLAFAIEGTDGATAYTLVQKRESGWHAPHAEQLESFSDMYKGDQLRGDDPFVFRGDEHDVVTAAEGALLANEIVAERFTVRVATFTQDEVRIHPLIQVPRLSNWWDCHQRTIPENEPFASFEGARQADVNGDGLDDLVLDIGVRYWRGVDTSSADSITNCDDVFERLPVEHYRVSFLFDGQTFREGENVDWLRSLYDDLE